MTENIKRLAVPDALSTQGDGEHEPVGVSGHCTEDACGGARWMTLRPGWRGWASLVDATGDSL